MERAAQQELVTEYLLVSRYSEPPTDHIVTRSLISAGFGTPEYTEAPPRDPNAAPTRRNRVGTYHLKASDDAGHARITVARYDSPALDGMSDSAFNQLTRRLGPSDVRTLRVGTLTFDTRITGPLARPLDTQRWALSMLRALVSLTEGAIIDPQAQTSWGGELLEKALESGPRAHLTVHNEAWGAERRWLHTHGMQKFGRPELDLADIPVALEREAEALLLDVADNLALGGALMSGQEVSLEELGSLIALPATPDAEHQSPWGRLRLCDIPTPPHRQGASARLTLARMALAEAERLRAAGDQTGALDAIERLLGADSDDSEALALKARILLDGGRSHDALELGELMELRAPGDYRGSYIIGLALMAIGRYREALNALDRAIEREPEAAHAYRARGDVYARLGDQRLAAVDRARAAYLGD
ncbi:MAG TPA: tetratricopeptide repeat protein [Ktedonobacterales bacterium]